MGHEESPRDRKPDAERARRWVRCLLPQRSTVRDDVITARDAWIQAVPGRSFHAALVTEGTVRTWKITLLEHEEAVAVGRGSTWELALENALKLGGRAPAG